MVEEGYVGHESPRFGGLVARLDRAGYLRRAARENVGRADEVETVEAGFLLSPGHRANLLATDVTHVGLGIVRAPDPAGYSVLWVTQVFAAPVPPPDPARIRAAFLKEIAAARRRTGRGAFRRDPALERAATRFAEGRRGPVDDAALQGLADASVQALAAAGRTDVRGVGVALQRVLSEADLKVPGALVSARSFAVAAVPSEDAKGRPRVDVVAVFAR